MNGNILNFKKRLFLLYTKLINFNFVIFGKSFMILQLKYFRFFGKKVSIKYKLPVGQTNPRTFLRKIDKVIITNLNLPSFPGQIYRV